MIQTENEFEAESLISTLKTEAFILVVAGVIICGFLFAFNSVDPEPQKPITPYEKFINPKAMQRHFLDGKPK